MGEEPGYIGVSGGVDVDPTDGTVGVGVNDVQYDPGMTAGYNGNPLEPGYYVEIPGMGGGVGAYDVPGGDPGEHYWGPPPGSLGNENYPY